MSSQALRAEKAHTADKELRKHRFVIMLSDSELRAINDFRFDSRIPTLSSAVRQLIEAGLTARATGSAS